MVGSGTVERGRLNLRTERESAVLRDAKSARCEACEQTDEAHPHVWQIGRRFHPTGGRPAGYIP